MAVFNNEKKGGADSNPNSLNLINSGTEIIGDLISNGDVRIDGVLRGTIHTKAKLVIGSTGIVEGDIRAQNSDISGNVKGNVNVDELLTLKGNGRVNGDITTKKLVVESGAEFNGKCQMRDGGKSTTAAANTRAAEPAMA